MEIPKCDYHGKCENTAYFQVHPFLMGDKYEHKGWSYLCREHFFQEKKKFGNELPWVRVKKAFLAYCSASIPGNDLKARIRNAKNADVALDVVVTAEDLNHKEQLAELLSGVDCPTIIAYDCHGKNIISSPKDREFFMGYISKLIEFAETIGSNHVLTAIYEKKLDDKKIVRKVYQELSEKLPNTVDILIEHLGGELSPFPRTVFCPSIDELCAFVFDLSKKNLEIYDKVGVVVDTAHLYNYEANLYQALENHISHIKGIHLKNSRVPSGKDPINFNRIGEILTKNGFSGEVTVECNQFLDRSLFIKDVKCVRGLFNNRV